VSHSRRRVPRILPSLVAGPQAPTPATRGLSADQQAALIWPILVERANGATGDSAKITYGDVCAAIGYDRRAGPSISSSALTSAGFP
jgi:hypothetical protein